MSQIIIADLDKRNSLVKQRAYLSSLIDRTEIQQKAVDRYYDLYNKAKSKKIHLIRA